MPRKKGYPKPSGRKVGVLNLLKPKGRRKVGVKNLVKIARKPKRRNNPFFPQPDLRGAKFATRRKKK